MDIKYENLNIRNADVSDAEQLCCWWNDGSVMAHAGFPMGLNTSVKKVISQIENENENTTRRHVILCDDRLIGEMSCRRVENNSCEIGIKICDSSMQNKGLGKKLLSMFISELFNQGFDKIILDTNLKNERVRHVYEQLGFSKVRVNVDAWEDQLGVMQTSIDYELTQDRFISYIK